MPKSVRITAPRPTFDELTRHLRIPKARQKELDAMAEEGVRQILKARREASAKTTVKRKVKPRDVSAAA
jgi:hypothetical protein